MEISLGSDMLSILLKKKKGVNEGKSDKRPAFSKESIAMLPGNEILIASGNAVQGSKTNLLISSARFVKKFGSSPISLIKTYPLAAGGLADGKPKTAKNHCCFHQIP